MTEQKLPVPTQPKLPAVPAVRTTPGELAARDLRRSLRLPGYACLAVVGLFFGVFGVWAALAPISSAAGATGVVSPEGSRKTIQHLEGGIIKTLHVREGDRIKKGDLLLTLDDTLARASFAALEVQALRFRATKMRIEALQNKVKKLDFGERFKAAMDDQEFAGFIANEIKIFELRQRTLEQQKAIYDQQIEQLKEEIRGYEAQIDSTVAQLGFIDDELKDTRGLFDVGLARKPRVLELERMRASLAGNRGQYEQSIAKSRQKISEIQLTQIDLENKFFNDLNEALLKTNSDLAQTDERISGAKDVLARTIIRAPVTGIVVNLRFKTTTGVVKAGEPILDIVPTEEDLVIEARIQPTDIDTLKPNQAAQVHLTPFHTRYTRLLQGTLRDVSADSLTDDRTGARYYKAFIVVDRDSIINIEENIQLAAGMPAEVFIRTGQHTFLEYLLEPLTRSIRRSMREK